MSPIPKNLYVNHIGCLTPTYVVYWGKIKSSKLMDLTGNPPMKHREEFIDLHWQKILWLTETKTAFKNNVCFQ